MTKRFAVFCPGQGAQHAAMFALTEHAPLQAMPTWRSDALQAILSDSADLFANRHAQPLIVAVGMTRWQALRSSLPLPSLIAGYSVGELTAYGVAGALDSASVIALAGARAAAMDRCVAPDQPQAMVAVSGLRCDQLLPILQQYSLAIAIQNDRDRMVVGGLAQHCAQAEQILLALGASCQRLPVTVASHTPLMKNAAAEFAVALEKCCWLPMSAPVLAGVDAGKIRTAPQAMTALRAQLTDTIDWHDCMDACIENGIEVVLELGPGTALSRMMTTRHPSVACRSLDEFRSLGAASDWLLRQLS